MQLSRTPFMHALARTSWMVHSSLNLFNSDHLHWTCFHESFHWTACVVRSRTELNHTWQPPTNVIFLGICFFSFLFCCGIFLCHLLPHGLHTICCWKTFFLLYLFKNINTFIYMKSGNPITRQFCNSSQYI